MIVVLLRDLMRPNCLFGWRAPAVEPGVFEPNWNVDLDAADFYAMVTSVNLEEDILATGYGLPRDCSPDGITWF